MTAFDNAQKFFDACERGKGWDGCKAHVAAGASFSCQAATLADVKTVEVYCEWMKGLVEGPLPDGRYVLHADSWDEANSTATFVATFHGTHTGEGGPVPATNKAAASEYVYAIKMDSAGKVAQMTKIWNDGYALAQLGWV